MWSPKKAVSSRWAAGLGASALFFECIYYGFWILGAQSDILFTLNIRHNFEIWYVFQTVRIRGDSTRDFQMHVQPFVGVILWFLFVLIMNCSLSLSLSIYIYVSTYMIISTYNIPWMTFVFNSTTTSVDVIPCTPTFSIHKLYPSKPNYPTIAVRLYSQLLVTQDFAILTGQVVIGRLFGISCRTRFETFEWKEDVYFQHVVPIEHDSVFASTANQPTTTYDVHSTWT